MGGDSAPVPVPALYYTKIKSNGNSKIESIVCTAPVHGGYYTDIWALYFILTLMKAGLEKQKWRGYKRMGLKLRLWRKDGDDPDLNQLQ